MKCTGSDDIRYMLVERQRVVKSHTQQLHRLSKLNHSASDRNTRSICWCVAEGYERGSTLPSGPMWLEKRLVLFSKTVTSLLHVNRAAVFCGSQNFEPSREFVVLPWK